MLRDPKFMLRDPDWGRHQQFEKPWLEWLRKSYYIMSIEAYGLAALANKSTTEQFCRV